MEQAWKVRKLKTMNHLAGIVGTVTSPLTHYTITSLVTMSIEVLLRLFGAITLCLFVYLPFIVCRFSSVGP